MRNNLLILFLPCLFSFWASAQSDSLPYSLYNDKLVVYTDLGYTSAPFSVSYPFTDKITKLRYRNNFRTILGIGLSYKWFSLRLGLPLPGYTRPVRFYGETKPFNIGFDFSLKKLYFDVDLRYFKGYSLMDAYTWNDTLSSDNPNDLRGNTMASSFSTNAWYFHHKDFKISALKGKTGHYNNRVHTWYIKNTINLFGVSNEKNSIVPIELIKINQWKTSASYFSSFDFGLIPGYAFVDRRNNWQFAIMGGFGAVVQAKFYGGGTEDRGFLGLAPRYDLKILGGYTVPEYFIFILTDFDNKSIRFNDLVYRQHFYSIKLVAGKRFNVKKKNRTK